MIKNQLHILILEDNQTDAELLERELRKGGFKYVSERVSTRKDFLRALVSFLPDLILADYNLPSFDGMAALKMTREQSPDTPFIIVSGFIGEELAVEIVKNGATDYILKDRISRLLPSVTRALKENEERDQRQRAENQLRESEEQYRVLFEGNPQPMWVYDLETYQFLAVNDAAVRHYGYSRKEFYSMKAQDLRPTEDRKVFTSYNENVIRKKTAHGIGRGGVWRHCKKDGNIILVEITWNVILFAGKNAVLVLANDITERKLAEEALKESEHKLREIIDLVPHFIFVKNERGEYLLMNKAVAQAYGTTIDELLNRTDFHFAKSPDEARRSHDDDLEVIRNNVTRFIPEQRFTDSQGNVRILQTIKMPFHLTESSQPAVLGMAIDITERKKTEEKIREQAALLDIASDAIIVRDMDGKILFWNKGAEFIYGWSAAEAIGKSVEELLFSYNQAQYREAQNAVISRDTWNGEMHQTAKDQRSLVVQSRWTLVRGNNRVPESVLILNTDITEKKKFEAQFMRAQRMESIGTLAGGIAHDLNNVLAPILLTIQNLKRKLPDERSQRMLNTVEMSTKRGAEMVQQVLTFTRGAEGEKVLLQPKHLIQEIEKIVRETFTKTIRIHARTTRDLWMLHGDATQLHQVLMNLCVNARDAMPQGGTLTIEGENVTLDENFARMHLDAKPGPYAILSVDDTGTGIAPAVIDKIFEPFFTTKEIGKGTGLGLSTVLAIVKGHGGFINVYSEIGKGTKFKVYLPAVITEEDTKLIEDHKLELPLGHGESILVVDDETSICEITKETLETYGYSAMIANDGTEALALFTQNQGTIKAVLTDMMMPFMDGLATIRALRKIDPDVKIIAASGLMSQDKISEPAGTNVHAFLQKPYTAEKLLKTLDEVLKK